MPNRAVLKVIENRDLLTVTPDMNVRAVASQMKQCKVAALLVVDQRDGKLIGICTERDLTFKVLAEGLDINSTLVGSVMTADPQSIGPDKPFGHALHMMFEGGFRHMPVIDSDGRPLGVISSRDALGLEVTHFGSELEQRETLTEIL
ncbi:MAG: CBS domain-containing protein [Betaproteobacteria bacterium]|jgi:CBS domain-containing protein|nr:CBS domain-containing protein [Betaproteobacteria bacterium]MBK8320465.1 CBS domain-containing protein [Betaproteobacteria bacterium]MBK9784030.1 CBS domain-containing protein [Candidatus Dechloromonas phosphorivorans]